MKKIFYWSNSLLLIIIGLTPKTGIAGTLVVTDTFSVNEVENWVNSRREFMNDFFQVHATITVYRGWDSNNAFAEWVDLGKGVISLGEKLIRNCVEKRNIGPLVLTAILAHEYAHILQEDNNCDLKGKYKELHADFMSGFYLGKMLSETNKIFVQDVMAYTFYKTGDREVNNPQHHGKPDERMKAALKGFSLEMQKNDIFEVYSFGLDFVKTFE